ncbi:hypothetical protein BDQ17DRAFT_1304856 [Cyathus striatus]|nr:hypothetical protein BDQ17DRAFT_1304856 [Cyathus striatus]
MNSLQDPSKKASINSLLNPQDASSAFPPQLPNLTAPVTQSQPHPHDHQSGAVYSASYHNNTPFNLRAASWDISDDGSKRKQDNSPAQQRHYHQPSMPSQSMYPDPHAPRLIRQRIDTTPHYSVDGQAWNSQQQDISGMAAYNTPVIGPMYSGERSTAISGDYQQHNSYNHGYQEQSTSNLPSASEWQKTERVSVRLSARASLADHHQQAQQQQHPQHQHHPSHQHPQSHPSHHQSHPPNQPHQSHPPLTSHHDARYNAQSSYYPPHGAFVMSSYPQHPPPHHSQSLSPQAPPPPPPQVPPQPQNPEASSKRPLPEADSAPVKKRSRAKKTVGSEATPGPSRRGYNAKKRSEAAQIAAQNAHLIPTVSYTQVPSEKGKGKDSEMRLQIAASTTGEGVNAEPGTVPLHPELQFARCMSNRYRSEQFPRCVSCTRRWAGDTCRFQGIRFFLKDQNRNIVGISFVESQKADAPTMNFPTKWNVPLTMEHIMRTKKVITQALLPTLRAELEHLKLPEIIRRPRECEVRATCDTCMTSLFSSSWMCRLCGREACAECFVQVRELTTDRPGATPGEIAALQAKRERHAHSNPFFLSCTRRNEHQEKDFSPMSRFCREELEAAIKEMEKLDLEYEEDRMKSANGIDGVGELMNGGDHSQAESSSSLAGAVPVSSPHRTPKVNGTSCTKYTLDTSLEPDESADPAFQPTNLPPLTASIPSHPIRRYADTELTSSDTFSKIWELGEPLVISNVLSHFKLQWTPEYFIEKYREQTCLIMECQTDQNKRVNVGEFFGWFGQYEGRQDCWKLKDWPPSTDFKTTFPELYEDFSEAVPIPDYVRRDGVYNIGSHFPSNSVGPDLGPKMYNAMASSFAPGSKGSTKLHMDMADALNIMTYASPCADGTPGYAAWDLFRAEDSDRVRAFLRRKFGGGATTDPIHTQTHYLDEKLREELWKEAGVLSYRVYQRPGEAVFVPAGCAHQVANVSDCMKVAIDYVSPENIARCERLTKEFREQNQSMVWKEDVLQLRTMMWFAWLSCCQQERHLNDQKGVVVPPGIGEAAA